MKTYFISFCNIKNLGCCIVDAFNEQEALTKTVYFGINPGGEAMFFEMDKNDYVAKDEIKRLGKNKLVSPEELKKMGYHTMKSVGEKNIALKQEGVSVVCKGCNEGSCKVHNQ